MTNNTVTITVTEREQRGIMSALEAQVKQCRDLADTEEDFGTKLVLLDAAKLIDDLRLKVFASPVTHAASRKEAALIG